MVLINELDLGGAKRSCAWNLRPGKKRAKVILQSEKDFHDGPEERSEFGLASIRTGWGRSVHQLGCEQVKKRAESEAGRPVFWDALDSVKGTGQHSVDGSRRVGVVSQVHGEKAAAFEISRFPKGPERRLQALHHVALSFNRSTRLLVRTLCNGLDLGEEGVTLPEVGACGG